MMMGDYTLRHDERTVEERKPINVDKDNFNQVLAEQKLELNLGVADKLSNEPGAEMAVNLKFKKLKDFTPEGIANQVPEMRKLLELRSALTALKGPLGNVPAFKKKIQNCSATTRPRQAHAGARPRRRQELSALHHHYGPRRRTEHIMSDGSRPRRRAGADAGADARSSTTSSARPRSSSRAGGLRRRQEGRAALHRGDARPNRAAEKVDKNLVDAMIAEIDQKLSAQINEILHHPPSRSWSRVAGLKFLIDQVDFRENIKVEMLNCSKEDLLNDFEDAPRCRRAASTRRVLQRVRQFGGKPVGLIVGNYEFGPGPQDIALLQKCASVAAMAHAPFISRPRARRCSA
jgi:type VI secretion system ImpB/VipA family protein